MNFDQYQWFILTAIGGKEDSIKESLIEKIRNFGYEDRVKEIKIFKEKIVKEQTFAKNDASLPKSMKNTKTTTWETLPNGGYKKIRTKLVNKFPGYIFINMIMDKDVWYAIRNTAGIMGFVGSSGKGALPIPISISEYENIVNGCNNATATTPAEEQSKVEEAVVEAPKQVFTTDLKVGDTVQITNGSFAGTVGTVKSLDINKGTSWVEVEFFGRATQIEVPFSDLKLD